MFAVWGGDPDSDLQNPYKVTWSVPPPTDSPHWLSCRGLKRCRCSIGSIQHSCSTKKKAASIKNSELVSDTVVKDRFLPNVEEKGQDAEVTATTLLPCRLCPATRWGETKDIWKGKSKPVSTFRRHDFTLRRVLRKPQNSFQIYWTA